ncbi:alpha/beta hydrolase [Limnoglobus roseus]|uniref:Hydrolase of the alpha/beta superfamily protein n=1 Tax=Limnoglobus roseus TaxID=2598579 RepID=A0A5C1ABI9_9BACT|nr:alpha/beta fold hydrolase [Limnoglobus roseus]QEL14388.1 Hydrolase of the alpha/beta superfamily protein [Limnoglobus roseus]
MPDWMILVLIFVFGPVPITAVFILSCYLYYRWNYIHVITRIFQERPLFIIPRGEVNAAAEDVRITTADGRLLRGCYLKTPAADRKGVILFGLEFGSDRWSCQSYCEKLVAEGYDVFAYEPRNQGDSDKDANYEPLQWVTDRDLADARAALKYLHYRPDADPHGVGIFGVSKGGSLGLLLAAEDRLVRCVVTDGAFGTYTTMVPFIRKWVGIYIKRREWLRTRIPDWFYGALANAALSDVQKLRHLEFVSVEKAVRRMRQPWLVIHGAADTYIKPEMAETLLGQAKRVTAKELWMVDGAKHNMALHVAGESYHANLVAFFDKHLGGPSVARRSLSQPKAARVELSAREAVAKK